MVVACRFIELILTDVKIYRDDISKKEQLENIIGYLMNRILNFSKI